MTRAELIKALVDVVEKARAFVGTNGYIEGDKVRPYGNLCAALTPFRESTNEEA